MDSSQNWLAFSLFNTPPSVDKVEQHGIGGSSSASVSASDSDLTMLNVYPKLEDFLGGSDGARSGSAPLGHFSSDNQSDATGIYDSELRTIAASFLHGYSSSMTDHTIIPELDTVPAVTLLPVDSSSKKAVDTFGQRTSIYRGVTRHRWTGRYEAHLWDNSCRREGQSRKGRQVYLGGYDKEDKAARAYDLAALKYWGPTTTTNFPVCNYEKELEEMKNMTRQEFVASLRRKSSGFSRGASIYRGVTRHHQHGRWQARIGRVAGNKDLYLGTFSTQEEAAEAYDIAAIKFRGLNAVTNFDMSRYDVKSIASSNLPIGGITGKAKASSESISDKKSIDGSQLDDRDLSSATSVFFGMQPSLSSTNLSFAIPIKPDPYDFRSVLGFQNPSQNYTNKNTNATSLFQSSLTNGPAFQSLSNVNMDFSTASTANQIQTNNWFLNGGFVQQHNNTSSIPFAAPINVSSSSWVAPSPHAFQAAKSNISVFQTPIFGME